MNEQCERYAFDIISMINQINDKLTDIKAAKDDNDTKKYNDLLTLFCNSFVLNYTFGTIKKPPQCTSDILSFMNDVIVMKPVWVKPVNIQKYIDTLQNQEVVAIIREVQAKIDVRKPFSLRGGGRRSFKKRTTSNKRKSIKRSRSNRRRHRRTARK